MPHSDVKPPTSLPSPAPQVGNGQLSLPEQRSHFALWCLLKSPLLIGTNLSSISTASASILRSPELLAVHQDPLGSAGDLLWKEGNLEVWAAALEVSVALRCYVQICCAGDEGVGRGAEGEQERVEGWDGSAWDECCVLIWCLQRIGLVCGGERGAALSRCRGVGLSCMLPVWASTLEAPELS